MSEKRIAGFRIESQKLARQENTTLIQMHLNKRNYAPF